MSKRHKYKFLSIPVAIIAAALSGGLVYLFWNKNLIWILFLSIILSTAIYLLLIILAIYCSKFWKSKKKLGEKLVSWGIGTFFLLVVIGSGIYLSWNGIVTIFLYTAGEITQAKIVKCEVKTFRGNEYYAITYQIISTKNDGVYPSFGKGELSEGSNCAINQAIKVHYLPKFPAISRMKISSSAVGIALFWNFSLCLGGCVYFWIEKPKCMHNYVRNLSTCTGP